MFFCLHHHEHYRSGWNSTFLTKKRDNARVVTYIGYHCSRQEKSFSPACVSFATDFFFFSLNIRRDSLPWGGVVAFSMTTAAWHGCALEGRVLPLGTAGKKHDRVNGQLPSSTSIPSSLSPQVVQGMLERGKGRESWSKPTQSRPGKHGALATGGSG